MNEWKKYVIIGGFAAFIILGAVLINGLINNGVFSKTDSTTEIKTTVTTAAETTTTKEPIIIEIKGEVYFPGVYEFYKDEIVVQDVINMAGGLTKKADTSLINLAETVENHSSIIIGTSDSKSYLLGEGESVSKININTCTVDELIPLEGIGSVKAANIISYRKKNGFFTSIDDLLNVEGIGETILEKIRDYITV